MLYLSLSTSTYMGLNAKIFFVVSSMSSQPHKLFNLFYHRVYLGVTGM